MFPTQRSGPTESEKGEPTRSKEIVAGAPLFGLSYLVGKHDLKFGYQFGRSRDRRVGFSKKTNGWVPPVCQTQTIFVNAQCFDKIPNVPDWFDLAPRFAIVYDVFGNGKTAVKVAANRYDVGIGSDHQFRVNPVNQSTQQ